MAELPSITENLNRLNPFQGLCLTADDLMAEQSYHRLKLHRHTYYLHGHGIVQGLQVELQQARSAYSAVIQPGYGITVTGQGVLLPKPAKIKLQVPKQDGEYMLWLFHVEQSDDKTERPIFDSTEAQPSRIKEFCAARLHPIEEDQRDAVAICRVNVRLGRMVQVRMPVPRAGRQARAAESSLKPRVVDFIERNKKILMHLARTQLVAELGLPTLMFSSALISAEFLLIEEGTSDRVLYRTAGSLISYAHDYYTTLPKTIKEIDKFQGFIQRVNAELPGPEQNDDVWLKWFDKFERLLQPLDKIVTALEKTVEAKR